MQFVTVYLAFNPADAQLACSRLQAAGFQALVADELASLSLDGYSMAAGGIRVQVPGDAADEAKNFLKNSGPATDAPDSPPAAPTA